MLKLYRCSNCQVLYAKTKRRRKPVCCGNVLELLIIVDGRAAMLMTPKDARDYGLKK